VQRGDKAGLVALAVQPLRYKHTFTRPASSSFGPITTAAGGRSKEGCEKDHPDDGGLVAWRAVICPKFLSVPYGMLLDSHA
jgi:hypothetical protein